MLSRHYIIEKAAGVLIIRTQRRWLTGLRSAYFLRVVFILSVLVTLRPQAIHKIVSVLIVIAAVWLALAFYQRFLGATSMVFYAAGNEARIDGNFVATVSSLAQASVSGAALPGMRLSHRTLALTSRRGERIVVFHALTNVAGDAELEVMARDINAFLVQWSAENSGLAALRTLGAAPGILDDPTGRGVKRNL